MFQYLVFKEALIVLLSVLFLMELKEHVQVVH